MAVEQNNPGQNSPAPKGPLRTRLEVWNEDRLVGHIWRDTYNSMGFRYHPQWLEQGGFPLSKTLPLRLDPFDPEEGVADKFFGNLLPEADFRSMLVWSMQLPNSDFDLLWALGGECAGALSIVPIKGQERREEQGPPPAADRRYRKLTEKQLAALAANSGHVITQKDGSRPRLSLAGAQGKCPVTLIGDDFYLPVYAAPTTHILKFESPRYSHLPANETFTTMLAKAVGLPVVDIHLHPLDRGYITVIKRYDRKPSEPDEDGNSVIKRLHQEDFCQALGHHHMHKYQEAVGGAPSLADCCRLVREDCRDWEKDLWSLLHWQIFNVLAGNSDGHAKNLSLLYLPGGETRLAPFYDLVCTRAIKPKGGSSLDSNVAFFIGGQRDPGLLIAKHWRRLAEDCDVPSSRVVDLVRETAENLQGQLKPTLEAFTSRYGPYPALQRVEQVVAKQCQRALSKRFLA